MFLKRSATLALCSDVFWCYMSVQYETDLAEWAHRNAKLLRSGQIAEADLENIAEELESLGNEQARALESRIAQILEHMLKLRLTTGQLWEYNHRGWRASIVRQQAEIERLLKRNPSLKRELSPALLAGCYADAAKAFAVGFEIEPPAVCPFSMEEILTGVSR
jgi:hypothetical protein